LNTKPLLTIEDLQVEFSTYKSVVNAVQGVSLTMGRGETLGLVGESGCGKSVTASSIMRLVPCPPGRIISGKIFFEGEDLFTKSAAEMREIRGKTISMIFQNPMTALNPVFTVGDQIETVIRVHQRTTRKKARMRAVEMFSQVGLSDPESTLKKHPFELSGGMCQRVMIAMALACQPGLLIADEPTTALDVTVQAQILRLMRQLKSDMNTSILLITHDLGVVARMCENVAVMYAGRIVEYGSLANLFKKPLHPYTRGLLSSTPKLGETKKRLEIIDGTVPDLTNLPSGCLFLPRCTEVNSECQMKPPALKQAAKDHYVACYTCAA
jgi:oligopeptide/dipeptide ABC transporter ATP-binding protein